MLITVTLNASVDKLYVVDKMTPGAVTRVSRLRNSAGGKGLNVARVISLLGETPLALGIRGGHAGRYFGELLQKDGIANDFAESKGETRCCVNVRDQGTGLQTEFLEAGSEVSPETLLDFRRKYEALGKKRGRCPLGKPPPGGPRGLLRDPNRNSEGQKQKSRG